MIALATACMGGIDEAAPLPQHPGLVRSVYYCDRSLPGHVAATWSSAVLVAPDGDPRLAAKYRKCQLPRLGEVRGCAAFAWADACMEFRSLDFLEGWARLAGDEKAVVIPHPDRGSVAEEYEYVLAQLKKGNPYLVSRYKVGPLELERDYFARRHDLSKLRLWAGGVWLFPNTSRVRDFFDAWWEIVLRFSTFDQCGFSVLLVEHQIAPVPVNLNLYRNEFFARRPHQ